MAEEVTMSVRLSKELRDAFDIRCKQNDETKSQVIRAFIKTYLSQTAEPKFRI